MPLRIAVHTSALFSFIISCWRTAMWKGRHFVSMQVGLVFQDSLWCPLVEFIIPKASPPPRDGVSRCDFCQQKNKCDRYEHTKAFISNIVQINCHGHHAGDSVDFSCGGLGNWWYFYSIRLLLCCDASAFTSAADTSSEVTSAAQIQGMLSERWLACHRKLSMNIESTHEACYFWSLGPIYIFFFFFKIWD